MTVKRKLRGQTENCIHCGRPASKWTGWVSYKDDALLAGFCSDRCIKAVDDKAAGLLAPYEPWMGKESL